MSYFEIVAHRGAPSAAPEISIASFQRAIELGADAVELDVRLTADHVPVVFHYFYLDRLTSISGPVFNHTLEQLRRARVWCNDGATGFRIATLQEVLEAIGGQIGLEIEIKGPEPEAPSVVAAALLRFKHLWDSMEVTSYEPMLLREVQERCRGLATDLLFARSEGWMGLDVVAYLAAHRARLARVRAIHLHPTQLSPGVVSAVQGYGIQVHSWEVNDEQALNTIAALNIPRICTDKLEEVLSFRRRMLP